MKRIVLIIKNDLKLRAKAPFTILIFLLIPILLTGIVGMIFGPRQGNNPLPQVKVLVVDKDKNIASKFLIGAFDSKELKGMFQMTVVDELEGKKSMSKGKASALIIIPEKFTKQLLNGEKTQLVLVKNPSEEFLPGIVEEFMNTISVVLSGFVQVFEKELKGMNSLLDIPAESVSIPNITPFMESGQQKIISLKKYLSPVLIQLKSEVEEKAGAKKKSGFNIFALILPGMAVMFLLFIVEAFVRSIQTERENGIIRRMMFSPLHAGELVTARIFSGCLMGIIVFAIMTAAGVILFNISWGNYGYLFILVAVTCFWCASFFALLNSFFKNKNQAGAFTGPIILVFSIFGGSMMPLNQFPKSMQWISYFTVNRWFNDGAQKIGNHLFPTTSIAILLVSGLILFVVAIFSLKRRITV